MRITLLLFALTALLGCWSEDLREVDLTGTVHIPLELADSSKELGMVFIGVYADADDSTLGITYPFMGPVVGSNTWGDSYPYGGTTVGTYTFPCVVEGKCEIITGRHADLDDVLDATGIGQYGETPWDQEDYWDACQEYFGYSSPEELEFVGVDNLDFHEADGHWIADFKIWHVDPQEDALARPKLWAFVDNGKQSCNPDGGASNRGNGPYFREGDVFPDVLNMPGKYLTPGDLYSNTPASLELDRRDDYEIVIDSVF